MNSINSAAVEDGIRVGFSGREQARRRAFSRVWNNELHAAFADIAPNYDRASNLASLGLYHRWLARFTALIEVSPGQEVLDVCAGTNAIGIALLKRHPGIRVSAIDRSAAMQEVGQVAARSLGLCIDGAIGDAHCLPYPDGSFDVVTLGWASRHLRIAEVLGEVRRVLRRDGRFYNCDMLRPENRIVEELYCAYLRACVSITALIFQSGPEAWYCRDYFVRAIRSFYSAGEFSEFLAQAGFREVSCVRAPGGVLAIHQAVKD